MEYVIPRNPQPVRSRRLLLRGRRLTRTYQDRPQPLDIDIRWRETSWNPAGIQKTTMYDQVIQGCSKMCPGSKHINTRNRLEVYHLTDLRNRGWLKGYGQAFSFGICPCFVELDFFENIGQNFHAWKGRRSIKAYLIWPRYEKKIKIVITKNDSLQYWLCINPFDVCRHSFEFIVCGAFLSVGDSCTSGT